MHRTHIGLQIPYFTYPDVPPAQLFERVAAQAVAAEQSGFDTVFVMDHFYQLPGIGTPDEPMLEAYTTLGALATATERVEQRVEARGVEDGVRRVPAEGLVEAEVGAGGARIVAAGAALEPAGGGVAVATRFGVGDVVHIDEVLEQRACGRRVDGHSTTRGR